MTYRDHIEQLAAELGAPLKFNSWQAQFIDSAAFDPRTFVVHLKSDDITTLQEYCCALHELGHCATLPRPCPEQGACTPDFILEYEVKAWEWARDNAMLGFDKVEASWALTTYMLGRAMAADPSPALDFIMALDVDREAYAAKLYAELPELALAA